MISVQSDGFKVTGSADEGSKSDDDGPCWLGCKRVIDSVRNE